MNAVDMTYTESGIAMTERCRLRAWASVRHCPFEVVSVGATDQVGGAAYSNFGAELDVEARGGNVQADVNGDGRYDGVLTHPDPAAGLITRDWGAPGWEGFRRVAVP